ncbi:MAG: hydrolase, partial [Hafnia sp.]
DLTIARLTQAGVVPIDTMGTISELQGTWNRPDAEQWAEVYAQAMPHYQLLIESHTRAQQAARDNEVLDSQRS